MLKQRYGIISYNLYCNFSNYGSALQQYALHRIVNELAPDQVSSIVMDYCPDCLADKDVLNPFKNMWDKDEESRKMVELTLVSAIKTNWAKFQRFFKEQYHLSSQKYTSQNFNESLAAEDLSGYICGSDTIWCTDEFGFDDGFYGEYPAMKESHTISYASSFGDAKFEGEALITLKKKLRNFKAIGNRENTNMNIIRETCGSILVQRVIDPTLLLNGSDYDVITAAPQYDFPYILLYARRYNPAMEMCADKLAQKYGCKVIDISLRAINAERGHIMRYDAGVEEFLSLVKHAKYIVTNSYHGAIFATQMHRDFLLFSREQCDTKIDELLSWIGLSDRKVITGDEAISEHINYEPVDKLIDRHRVESIDYLKKALMVK